MSVTACVVTLEAERPTKRSKIIEEPALRVKRLSPNAILPSRGSSQAAGYDLYRCGSGAGELRAPSSCAPSSAVPRTCAFRQKARLSFPRILRWPFLKVAMVESVSKRQVACAISLLVLSASFPPPAAPRSSMAWKHHIDVGGTCA